MLCGDRGEDTGPCRSRAIFSISISQGDITDNDGGDINGPGGVVTSSGLTYWGLFHLCEAETWRRLEIISISWVPYIMSDPCPEGTR